MDIAEGKVWQNQLERLLASSGQRDIVPLIEEVCALAAEMGHDVGDRLLDAHPELLAHRPALTEAFRRTIVAREVAEAERLLALELDGPVSFGEVAGAYAAGLYARPNEIFERVDFRDCRRVVAVGCGWRPITAFRIHDETAVPEIVGIDMVPAAVETANRLAAKLGYRRLRAELCDGRDFDYAGAGFVYVSSMVSPKAEVVSRIADTAPEDVRIVLWEPVSLGRLWAESAEAGLDTRLEVIGRGGVSWLTRDVFVARRDPSGSRKVT